MNERMYEKELLFPVDWNYNCSVTPLEKYNIKNKERIKTLVGC